MADVRAKISEVGPRRIASSIVVVVFLALFVLTGGWRLLADTFAGWFENGLGLHENFEPAHRIHGMTFSLVIWPAIIGMVAQLRSPRRHVAGQLMAVLPWVVLVIAFAITDFWKPIMMIGIMGGLVLLTTLLHPAGLGLVSAFDGSNVSRVMLALVLVASVPLGAFAANQVGLQTGAIEQGGHEHGEAATHEKVHQQHLKFGHFTTMAAFAMLLIGMGLLSSLRPVGWWLPAGLTGVLAAYYGLLSMAFPETASSAGMVWGLATVVWGVTFLVAAERARAAELPSPYGEQGATATLEE